MDSFQLSDVGIARELNEDSFGSFVSKDGLVRFFIVADGMGGHLAGEVASGLAVSLLGSAVGAYEYTGEESLKKFLMVSIAGIDNEIKEKAKASEQCSNMGTTAVVYAAAENYGLFCNVGDSRGYLLSEGLLCQVTRDHSLVQSMLDSGYIFDDETQKQPFSNAITKALGFLEDTDSAPVCDIFRIKPQGGDVVLLCSDGLSGMVENDTIKNIIEKETDVEAAAKALISEANNCGGNDNITVTLVKYGEAVSDAGLC